MKHKNYAAIGLVLLLGATVANATSEKGGGGGIPSPFATASNHKVELADGELYLLAGMVTADDIGQAVFWVDLKKESWLANKERVASPYYRLAGSPSQWAQHAGKPVMLACIAKAVASGGSFYIELVPADNDVERAVCEQATAGRHGS